MPTITLRTAYAKNSELVVSPQEIRRNYLYGLSVNSSFANKVNLDFSDDDIAFHLLAAQKEIENFLGLKLKRQIYNETLPFDNDEWKTWGYVKTSYMVVFPLQLQGFLNTTKQTDYPAEWLTSKKEGSDELYHRIIYIVPAGNTGAITNSMVFSGLLPNLGYLNAGRIPNYWSVNYVTGFDKVPYDIIQAVSQIATVSMLYIAGANIFGWPGVASQSISIDGLSQSMSSQLNAFGARIAGYNDDLQRRLPRLRDVYRGFSFMAM